MYTDFSGSCRACRYLKVSWSSHACQTFAHISTEDKKARGLMQHRGSLDVRQAGDWPYAASELHHSPVPGPVASFTFNQPDPQLPCHTDCLSINMGTGRCLLGQWSQITPAGFAAQRLLPLSPCPPSVHSTCLTGHTRVLVPPHPVPSLPHGPPPPLSPYFQHPAARRAALLQQWWGCGTLVHWETLAAAAQGHGQSGCPGEMHRETDFPLQNTQAAPDDQQDARALPPLCTSTAAPALQHQAHAHMWARLMPLVLKRTCWHHKNIRTRFHHL